MIRDQNTIRNLQKAIIAARDSKEWLDLVVIRREIFVSDGPVLTKTVVVLALGRGPEGGASKKSPGPATGVPFWNGAVPRALRPPSRVNATVLTETSPERL